MYDLRDWPTTVRFRSPTNSGHITNETALHRIDPFGPWPSDASACNAGAKTGEGHIVAAVTIPWLAIMSEIERDASFLHSVCWQKLEELVAAAYEFAGYEVTLTPRSGDGGRDIIATKHDICSIRIIDQIKAYAPGRRVTANDVRALLGVLSSDLNASKGIATTNADFAPRIKHDPSIQPFMPFRLELRNGVQLRDWLLRLKASN